MEISFPNGIMRGTFSVPKSKGQKYIKARIQRINIKGEEVIQLALYSDKQVFHQNLKEEETTEKFKSLLMNEFNNAEIETIDTIYSYRISSKGKLLTNKRKNDKEFVILDHNKKKKYLLEEGIPVPPLVDLGVMLQDGRVVKAYYDKFKQINRFLEIVEDSIQDEKKLKIIDFGCGKSYLTFILYYYLTFIKKIDCKIIGLDLKEDVVDKCNKIAIKYGYSNLQFLNGDIAKFKEEDNVDMIVTLHACDTATDYALYYAIQMKCRYIFSVPCCQHEINLQLKENSFHLFTQYGILKERFSALITDAIRANILQYCGYKTQVMEFIDIENSPKNLLIRATLQENNYDVDKIKNEIDNTMKALNVNQTLYNLIFKK